MPLLVAVALVLTAAPFIPASNAEGAKTTLRIGMIEAIDSLNPFIGVNDNAYIFYGLVYDYLTAVDQDMKIKPNLATSWNIVPLSDPAMASSGEPFGSVWQYNLTQNAKWHDGEQFDADDVVFTINYQIGPNYDSIWAYQPYTRFIRSVEKLGDYTVRIHFKDIAGNPAPCPFGDALMMPMMPEHIWSKFTPYNAAFTENNYWPIGTGPFMCSASTEAEFIAGDMLILDRNPDYHGEADYGKKVNFDRIILKFYLEAAGMLVDIQKGAVDLAGLNAPNYQNLLDWLQKNPTDAIGHYAGLSCTGFSVELLVNNKASAPGQNTLRLDPEVRKAMAHSIDKGKIRDSIYAGYAQIGSTIIAPIYGDFYWTPNATEVYDFNITKANEILDAAGYVWDGNHKWRLAGPGNAYASEGTQLKFKITAEQELIEDRDTVNYLAEEWQDIGIEVVPDFVNTIQWGTTVYGGAYELAMTYWSGDPDPNYLLFIQTRWAIGGWSENLYSNPDYDNNYTASEEAVNHQERLGYIQNCSRMSYRDASFIVTVYPYGCYAWREDHFSGWGDLAAHPGRSLSSFWTANDLWFDLVPLEHRGTDMTYVYVGVAIAIVAVGAIILFMRMRGDKEDEVRLP